MRAVKAQYTMDLWGGDEDHHLRLNREVDDHILRVQIRVLNLSRHFELRLSQLEKKYINLTGVDNSANLTGQFEQLKREFKQEIISFQSKEIQDIYDKWIKEGKLKTPVEIERRFTEIRKKFDDFLKSAEFLDSLKLTVAEEVSSKKLKLDDSVKTEISQIFEEKVKKLREKYEPIAKKYDALKFPAEKTIKEIIDAEIIFKSDFEKKVKSLMEKYDTLKFPVAKTIKEIIGTEIAFKSDLKTKIAAAQNQIDEFKKKIDGLNFPEGKSITQIIEGIKFRSEFSNRITANKLANATSEKKIADLNSKLLIMQSNFDEFKKKINKS